MYTIGQKFEGVYPPEAALWCNENGAMIAAAGSGYEIQAIPEQAAEQLFEQLRVETEQRLTATDKYLMSDYPISTAKLVDVKAYRAELRALNHQPGAPWDGGGDATPWPTPPEV